MVCFYTGTDIIVYLAKRDSVGCADSALYRADLIGIGQSGNPDIAYRFADMSVILMPSLLNQESRRLHRGTGLGTARPFIWRRASQSSCAVSLSWSSSGPCRHGMIFMLQDAKSSEISEHLG